MDLDARPVVYILVRVSCLSLGKSSQAVQKFKPGGSCPRQDRLGDPVAAEEGARCISVYLLYPEILQIYVNMV